MQPFRYKLDPSPKKYDCPACSQTRFVKFVDQQNGEYLPLKFGRCDREQNCGYYRSPYQENEYQNSATDYRPIKKPKVLPEFITDHLFQKSLGNYDKNNFIKFLRRHFDTEAVNQVIDSYKIGTSLKIPGGCIFYQIDHSGKVRRGKIIVYNSETGKRGAINSVHSQLKIHKDRYPKWRFFGEHLLRDNNNPVAIVESEKTAIITSLYFPEFVWLATGTKSTLKPEYGQALKDRSVTLFPDIGAYQEWSVKLDGFSKICSVSISDLLEMKSGEFEKSEGLDLADYLITRSVGEFK